MRESILTIPINEVFEPREGCPICAMRNTVEQHISEYIMGAAMMEPDVRMETNRLGFCHTHFNSLLKQNNRLSLGLMLNTKCRGTAGAEVCPQRYLLPGAAGHRPVSGCAEQRQV